MGGGKSNGVTLEDEIYRQVTDGKIVLCSLTNEDKHLSGEFINGDDETEYDTGLMFDQILERNYGKWRDELAALPTIEEQDTYYRSVIYPHLKYLEWRVEDRHADQRDGRKYETMLLYDESLDDLTDLVFKDASGSLHELVTDPSLCLIIRGLTEKQRYVIYLNAVSELSTQEISAIKKTTDRNVLKIKDTALRHIRGQYLPVVMFKYKVQTDKRYRWLYESGVSTSFWERLFAATIGEDYTDYYKKMTFDFVEITKDYRAQAQRMRDNTARLLDEKRRYKELVERKKDLKDRLNDGNIYDDDNSYEEWDDDDYAQDI